VTESPRVVTDLHQLIDEVSLSGFITYELAGRRRDGGFGDTGEPVEATVPTMQVLVQETPEQIAVRLRGHLNTERLVDLVADMSAIYNKTSPFTAEEDVLHEFVRHVAVMSLYPYVRQQIHDLGSRLGQPLTLELLKAADLQLDVARPEPAST
jgi:hypothetical protein